MHCEWRRPRIAATAKGQHKVTAAITKKDLKPIGKMATNDVSNLVAIETITQRTRNLRKSLHKIQKQFDNQAITKFFQRTLKANTYSPQFGSDNDENACDAFNNAEQLSDNDGTDNQLAQINEDNEELSSYTNNENDNANKNDNVCLINGDNDQNDQNTNGTTTNSIQHTNIFLQKPVLHLNIDKSLNQASSIVINKHLEVVGPNFATSFPAFANNISVQNTANNIQNKSSEDESSAEQNDRHTPNESIVKGEKTKGGGKPRLRKRRPRKCASRWAIDNNGALIDAIIDSDSNSCDSGVVSDRSFELNSTDGNKPTTPHRIVCPSTTSTPTHEETPGKCSPASNILNRMNQVKRPTVKRARGKQTPKSPRINDAKSFFTKLTAVVDAKIAEDTKTEENLITDESKNDIDCEMSAIIIEPNDVQIVKCSTPKPMVSRSSTPLQKPMQSKQMTDFFPVRRSIRKTKKAVEQEHLRYIEKAIEQQCEDGLVVKYFKEKGRGICAGRPFARGEFVIEYIGDLIEQNEADRREEIYAKDAAFGCYMYYFKHKEQQWCIDATAETGKLGRLVNHSRNGNLVTKIVTYKNRPHLVLIAKENIKEGEELTYDYGDRTRESLVNHPWLAL
ncbi:histone-lysine N-methyltransferase PR-Set7-like isoform X2 [Contarinia nasturtii]|uniref:histone-lysine N-methyltransferase PR-Set7-like isoform X2 n=1 Tax=Contarinia nasturtii TaxID=265458 RepID=UPI0012D43935|nr:histone-lysine N-methyltransferase PR-Set7-like isoform X2 [Contarinia nasturtii]